MRGAGWRTASQEAPARNEPGGTDLGPWHWRGQAGRTGLGQTFHTSQRSGGPDMGCLDMIDDREG